jgi:putative FmdB family regulatory protein
MPIYEYCCQDCGHRLEAIQRLADAPLTDCPACSQSSLKKQVSAPSFRLSGGGWYETDFKTGDKKKNLAGDRGGASGNDGSSKQSGESGSGESAKKPAEKSAASAKSEATKAS